MGLVFMGGLVNLCREIAEDAHRGQRRKLGSDRGKPYIVHPERMASLAQDDEAKAAAWLHDVVEDTPVTLEGLRRRGIPEDVVAAVDALTRRDGETYLDFLARIMADPLAVEIKLLDLADNMRDLDEGSMKDKYRLAEHILRTQGETRKGRAGA